MGEVVFFEDYGSPQVLRHADVALPAPGRGEVRVSNRAISVNPADWMVIAGMFHGYLPRSARMVPGVESAGVVEALGRGVTRFAVGDEVIRVGTSDSYRQVGNYALGELIPKPSQISFGQAAVLSIAAGTAYSAIEQIAITESDTLLIHGAAGGVGSAAIQIARSLGARVLATASAPNHDYLRTLGAEPVEYGDGLVERLRERGQITAVLDAAGNAESVSATVALLADRRRAVSALRNRFSDAAGISGVHQVGDRVAAVLELATRGLLWFELSLFPLAGARQALEISAAGHVRGKIVLIPEA